MQASPSTPCAQSSVRCCSRAAGPAERRPVIACWCAAMSSWWCSGACSCGCQIAFHATSPTALSTDGTAPMVPSHLGLLLALSCPPIHALLPPIPLLLINPVPTSTRSQPPPPSPMQVWWRAVQQPLQVQGPCSDHAATVYGHPLGPPRHGCAGPIHLPKVCGHGGGRE
jgi:hypothetical protein